MTAIALRCHLVINILQLFFSFLIRFVYSPSWQVWLIRAKPSLQTHLPFTHRWFDCVFSISLHWVSKTHLPASRTFSKQNKFNRTLLKVNYLFWKSYRQCYNKFHKQQKYQKAHNFIKTIWDLLVISSINHFSMLNHVLTSW